VDVTFPLCVHLCALVQIVNKKATAVFCQWNCRNGLSVFIVSTVDNYFHFSVKITLQSLITFFKPDSLLTGVLQF
jgi:hypothetical protein